MNEQIEDTSGLFATLPPLPDKEIVDNLLAKELTLLDKKIVVLDDDPTGIQAVNDIFVYTNWNKDTILEGFEDKHRMFFVLTNSRGLTTKVTQQAHQDIADNLLWATNRTKQDFILISRSDSTLRGHYPLETETLRQGLEKDGTHYDGEILYPFFLEGGRFTINDVHYVQEGQKLVPAGQTEFAKDKTFGYHSSNLKEYCAEKTKNQYLKDTVISITLQELRGLELETIENKLLGIHDFEKIVVNSVDYYDVKVFMIAFCRAVRKGKRFMFRGAAAITKILGAVKDKPLLQRKELRTGTDQQGGLVLVGSYVQKTTKQLEVLRQAGLPIKFIEFQVKTVLEPNGLAKEVDKTIRQVDTCLAQGQSVVVYTSREQLVLPSQDANEILSIYTQISDAFTSIAARLKITPAFIIAKGGITSSDVGVKALKVRKAYVLGQVAPGIPVWKTGPESRFPNIPYIIFPGNVGNEQTLKSVVASLL